MRHVINIPKTTLQLAAILLLSFIILACGHSGRSKGTGAAGSSAIYTVSFDTNEGIPPDPLSRSLFADLDILHGKTYEVEDGASMGNLMPQAPERDGYFFTGWATERSAAFPNFDAYTPVTSDLTVYAVWTDQEPGEYIITFDGNGGEFYDDPLSVTTLNRTAKAGATLGTTMPLNPEHDDPDFIFIGWSTYPNGMISNFCANTSITSNLTVYAIWADTDEYYTVTFNANGGIGGGSIVVQGGKTVGSDISGVMPDRPGYTLSGWSVWEDAKAPNFDENVIITQNVTVYAQWERIQHTVTFDANGGTGGGTVLVTDGSAVGMNMPEVPSLVGWSFAGWASVSGSNIADFTASTPVTGNITVYAIWTKDIVYFTVTFDANGGIGGPSSAQAESGSSLGGAMPAMEPTREGYEFAGWAQLKDSAAPDFTADTIISGNITVYAVWINTCTVIFDLQGAGENISKKVSSGATVELPSDPSISGKYFVGWTTRPNGKGSVFNEETLVTSNITVYAVFSYIILNRGDLEAMEMDGSYVLGNDIDLSGSDWEPLGSSDDPFTGSLFGDGYEIANISVNGEYENAGLFAATNDAVIDGIQLKGTVDNRAGSGGSEAATGGIIGNMNKTAVRNSCFIGRIESDSYNESFIGGIAGIARNSSVSSACFSGQIDIADTAPHAGGIVGHMDGSRIENSYAKGSVASSANSVTVGGIAGSMEGSSTIALSYTVMTMQATGFKVNIGGIAGAAELSTIKNCTVLGSSLTGDQSGRIAGNVDTVTFIDNYAISSMVIVGSTGGFIKGTDTKQGADVSTANESFFKDILMWDFTRIWKMPYGQTYPTLEWQTAAP